MTNRFLTFVYGTLVFSVSAATSLVVLAPKGITTLPPGFMPHVAYSRPEALGDLLNVAQITRIEPTYTDGKIDVLKVTFTDGKSILVFEDYEDFLKRIRVALGQ